MKHLIQLGGVSLLVLVTACGGGGGGGSASSGTASAGLTLTGVAATGAAISGGAVDVKCKSGTGTATTNSDGSYTVTVTDGVGPCMLKVVDPITQFTAYSFVESGATVANINPVTHLVVANALGDEPSTAYTSFSSTVQGKITSSNISTALTNVRSATTALGTDGDMSGIDVLKVSMRAATGDTAGDSTDKKIDALMAALAASDKKITDLTTQLKTVTTSNDAITKMNTVVGDSKYSLASCPYARSGNIWVMDMIGLSPILYNLDFSDASNMKLKDLRDNSISIISLKVDTSSNPIPCAFKATVKTQLVEFRVSEGGVGAWINTAANDFGLFVPQQKLNSLTDSTFVGSFPSLAFIQRKNSSFRMAIPIAFNVGSDGVMKSYGCDMTLSVPTCSIENTNTSTDTTTCSAISNGTLDCTSTSGMAATAILYTNGSQTTMFMAITNMNVGTSKYGGLMVMTKAANMKLPKLGEEKTSGNTWYVGVEPGSTTVYAKQATNSTTKVESVSSATSSFTTSTAGSSAIDTLYINTPSTGMGYIKTTAGAQGVAIGSSTGWSLVAGQATSSGVLLDGWFAYIKENRSSTSTTVAATVVKKTDATYMSTSNGMICIANC